jgi:hypothetical protein
VPTLTLPLVFLLGGKWFRRLRSKCRPEPRDEISSRAREGTRVPNRSIIWTHPASLAKPKLMIRLDRERARSRSGRQGEGEQAGAKQHEAGCGQGQEAFGDKVMVAHVNTLPTRRSSQLIKIFGTSSLMKCRSQRAAVAIQVRDKTPSNAWARKMPAPTKPIAAVNISNIAVVLSAPPRMHTKRPASPHSQKQSEPRAHNAGAVGLWRNRCVRTGHARVAGVAQKQRLGNHRKALPISAVIRLRYLQTLLRRWAVAYVESPAKLPLT